MDSGYPKITSADVNNRISIATSEVSIEPLTIVPPDQTVVTAESATCSLSNYNTTVESVTAPAGLVSPDDLRTAILNDYTV